MHFRSNAARFASPTSANARAAPAPAALPTWMIFSSGIVPPKEAPVEERYVRKEESEFNNPDTLFDPYKESEGWFS